MTSPSTPSTPLPSRLGGGGGTTATTTYRSLWLSRIAAGSCRQNKWENYRKCTIFEGMLGIFFWTISQYLKDKSEREMGICVRHRLGTKVRIG